MFYVVQLPLFNAKSFNIESNLRYLEELPNVIDSLCMTQWSYHRVNWRDYQSCDVTILLDTRKSNVQINAQLKLPKERSDAGNESINVGLTGGLYICIYTFKINSWNAQFKTGLAAAQLATESRTSRN